MLDRIIKYIPITTLIILFLYVCGGLYLIGYWSKFDVDISNIVSISEIPKSFILPFAITNGLYLFTTIFNTVTITEKDGSLLRPINFSVKSKFWNLVLNSANFHIIILSGLIIFLWGFLYNSPTYWLLSGLFLSLVLMNKANNLPLLKEKIPNAVIRHYIAILLIFTPIMCLTLGVTKGVRVYNNKQIKYINAIRNNSKMEISATKDSSLLKFIGFLGDKFIISSLDNKRIIVLNQSSFDGVELIDPPNK